MSGDISENIELMPIAIGFVISLIFVLAGVYNGVIGMIGVFIGSLVAGIMSKNSTKYALIYGLIIGLIGTIITSIFLPDIILLVLIVSFIIYVPSGLIGAFVGKVIQSRTGFSLANSVVNENLSSDDINFCSNCGSKVNTGAKFCSKCGNELN